jgi:CO/xanthine dehydrogenase Mo-binding subunit
MSVSEPNTGMRDLFATAEYRADGRDKVSGRALYTADVARKGALWAAFVESPHAHAKIRSIDAGAAKAMPGVRAVLTGTDVEACLFGRQLCDWPVLADRVVRFIGDRVAAVAAESPDAAAEAARAVRVEYDELPAVLDVDAALREDAQVLHPDWDSYYHFASNGPLRKPRAHPNEYAALRIGKGSDDLEPIFARAFRVFEHSFETPRQHAGYIEPRSTLVWIEGEIVRVVSPNKGPFALRRHLAHVLGVPEERIVIEPAAIGGDFGGKGLTVDELPCYFLARATGRPVRYVSSYAEELRRGPTRHRTAMTLRSALDRDGTFLAHRSTVVYDGGAYAAAKPIPSLLPGNGYGSIPYRIPHVRIDIRGVYTNTLPAAHVRGPGEQQTFSAWELHVDTIARAMGIDPFEFRLKNVVRDGETIVTGEAIDRPMAYEILQTLRDECPPMAARDARGRGISLVCAHTGSGKTSVRMSVRPDGTVEVTLGAVDQGVGIATVVRRVVSAALSVDPESVGVKRGSTDDALPDPGSGHSRVTHVVGRAVLDAAQQVRERLEDARTSATDGFALLAERACSSGPVDVVGTFTGTHEQVQADLSFGAYAIEVDVDRDTGAVAVQNAVFVGDVGQIINPVAHQGQIYGGFVFGLGAALTEDVRLDQDGKPLTLSLGEYKLLTARDVPPLRTVLLEGPGGDGPYGTRMIGELCNVGVPAALINAVDDAVGVRLVRFPVHAEDVHAALVRQNA